MIEKKCKKKYFINIKYFKIYAYKNMCAFIFLLSVYIYRKIYIREYEYDFSMNNSHTQIFKKENHRVSQD